MKVIGRKAKNSTTVKTYQKSATYGRENIIKEKLFIHHAVWDDTSCVLRLYSDPEVPHLSSRRPQCGFLPCTPAAHPFLSMPHQLNLIIKYLL